MEWMRALPSGGDENKDDDEKERSIGAKGKEKEEEEGWVEREERGGGEGEGGEKLSSDVEELRVSQLVDPSHTHSAGEDDRMERESSGSVQEKFSEIFGMAPSLDKSPSDGGLDGSPEGVGNFDRRPSPLRPQQMFTSTEKSEIVTIQSKALTPTKEAGTEVVNTTGTPSAEFMEMFSHQQTPRKGSKVTTPQGEMGNNEMMSGFAAPSWMEKMSDNAASAWPDLGASDIPKLVPQDEEVVETPPTDSTHGAGPGSEVGEAGRSGVDPFDVVKDEEGGVGGEMLATYGGLFPSALPVISTSKPQEVGVPLLRATETTEGETGQMLPSSVEQVAPPEHDLLSGAAFVPPVVVDERGEEGEGKGEGEGEEGRGGAVEESTGAKSELQNTKYKCQLIETVLAAFPQTHDACAHSCVHAPHIF